MALNVSHGTWLKTKYNNNLNALNLSFKTLFSRLNMMIVSEASYLQNKVSSLNKSIIIALNYVLIENVVFLPPE